MVQESLRRDSIGSRLTQTQAAMTWFSVALAVTTTITARKAVQETREARREAAEERERTRRAKRRGVMITAISMMFAAASVVLGLLALPKEALVPGRGGNVELVKRAASEWHHEMTTEDVDEWAGQVAHNHPEAIVDINPASWWASVKDADLDGQARFIKSLYFIFEGRREATDPTIDLKGFGFWLSELRAGADPRALATRFARVVAARRDGHHL